jgi:small GTP-binding protein
MEFTLNSLAKTLGKPIDKDLVRRRKDCFSEKAHNRKKYITAISLPESSSVTTLILNEEAIYLEYLYANGVETLQQVDFQLFENVEYIDLSNCNLIGDVVLRCAESHLKQIYLQNNKIESIRFIGNFPKLQLIDICKNQLKSIVFEGDFKDLNYLYLNDNQLVTIDLSNLNTLKTLHLAGNLFRQTLHDFTQSSLETLRLADNPLPNSIRGFAQEHSQNCLESVRHYYAGLDKGAVLDNEHKVLLVGNGNVGKSCMVERLVYDTFQKDWHSTHGIALKQYEHTHQKVTYLFNLWDFGGQDIYHATHRLFMQANALYLILWDLDTEKNPHTSCNEDGQVRQHENHKLPYWLDYAKSQGKKSPMIVVQTKAALNTPATLEAQTQIGTMLQNYQQSNEYLVFKSVDSSIADWDENGYEALLSSMRAAVKSKQKGIKKHEIPANRAQLRQILRDLQAKGEKVINVEKYLAVAKDFSEQEAFDILNNWLVFTGVVYYRKGYFEDKIILKQDWVIEAIYTLFRRDTDKGRKNKTYYSIQQAQGKFTGADLRDIWEEKYPEAEQNLFVGFMLSCHLCFETTQRENTHLKEGEINVLPFEKRHFIAPQMMPEVQPKLIEDVWRNIAKSWYLKYEHDFLHYGIMQSFIVQTQYLADTRAIWQLGILLAENGHYALVNCIKQTIYVRVTQGGDALLNKIRNLLDELQSHQTKQERVSVDGQNYVLIEKLKAHSSKNPEIDTETGKWIPFAAFDTFLKRDGSVQFSDKDAEKNNYLKMTLQDLQEAVRVQVGKDKIQEAIQIVETWAAIHSDDGIQQAITLIAADRAALQKQNIHGIIEPGQDLNRIAHIRSRLLEIHKVSSLS